MSLKNVEKKFKKLRQKRETINKGEIYQHYIEKAEIKFNVKYDIKNAYIVSKWMAKRENVYNMGKPDGNKINGKRSDYPWTAFYVKESYKKYVLNNGRKPSRKYKQKGQ